jgi:hypothetical protein
MGGVVSFVEAQVEEGNEWEIVAAESDAAMADAVQSLLEQDGAVPLIGPPKTRGLLEQVVEDCNERFGVGDERGLRSRFDLALAYGTAGDYVKCHETSAAFLSSPDCRTHCRSRRLRRTHQARAPQGQLSCFLLG